MLTAVWNGDVVVVIGASELGNQPGRWSAAAPLSTEAKMCYLIWPEPKVRMKPMSESPCTCYTSWENHGVLIKQCLEFYEGICGAEMSPHYKQPCPWENGYP